MSFLLCSLNFLTIPSLQRSPGGPQSRGQVRSVRPGPPRSRQGHNDLHAADEVHVYKHDELGADQ